MHAIALLLFCVACRQSAPDSDVDAIEEIIAGAAVDDAGNTQGVSPESALNTGGNKPDTNEPVFSPATETSPSPSPVPDPAKESTQTTTPEPPEDIPENDETTAVTPEPSQTQETPAVSPTPEASATSPELTSETPSPTPASGEPIVLTICGDGVSGESTWTLKQLQDMSEGYREVIYSTTNNWPSYGHTSVHGISLPYLLGQAGILSNAASFKFSATDGYNITATYNQVFGAKYAFTVHGPSGSSGAYAVEPVIAWEFGDAGKERAENIRIFFGQSSPQEVNTSAFVSNLFLIDVSTVPQGAWDAPGASIADGSAVQAGTELSLTHDSMDNVRIYYTLDGSEPDYNSLVYNRSASYFQPDLITPLVLTEDVTVKAFAAGIGREPSQVVTYSYQIAE